MIKLKREMIGLAQRAKDASVQLAQLKMVQRNQILREMAASLRRFRADILRTNQRDIRFAKKQGLSAALIDRLTLTHKRLEEMAVSIKAVAALEDPIGKVLSRTVRPNGLRIEKVAVPLGVILIIYEARPNVTSECASLCLKSGNSVILRGGRETIFSNRALVSVFQNVLRRHGVSPAAISLVETTNRQAVDFLLKLDEWINLVIPRGGENLIRKVARLSTIPVIKHYKGICHVYVDRKADLAMAERIAFNAKCQRPAVCNAMETLLVHRDIAKKFLPRMRARYDEAGCELVGCPRTRRILKGIGRAAERDWKTEYLDLKLSVKVVDDVQEAIDHINRYGSSHTDAIVTRDRRAAQRFLDQVDSSSVMWNTSTRFSDGFQYGLGAEIGISTDKIHARGPMGLEGLTSYKYVVYGKGQVRS